MISSLPDLSALYSPASPLHPGDALPFPDEGKGRQAEKGDRADLSALSREFARKGGAFALFEFEYQSVHAVSLSRDARGASRREYWSESFEMRLSVGGDPEAARKLFEKLKEEYRPEKVADRIVGFALKGAGGRGEAYRDLLRAAIEIGYSEARRMLGPLDEKVESELEETLRLVRERLQPKQDQEDKPLELSSIAA